MVEKKKKKNQAAGHACSSSPSRRIPVSGARCLLLRQQFVKEERTVKQGDFILSIVTRVAWDAHLRGSFLFQPPDSMDTLLLTTRTCESDQSRLDYNCVGRYHGSLLLMFFICSLGAGIHAFFASIVSTEASCVLLVLHGDH